MMSYTHFIKTKISVHMYNVCVHDQLYICTTVCVCVIKLDMCALSEA